METCLKNYPEKLSYTKLRDNLILKLKFQGLFSFQRERTSLLITSSFFHWFFWNKIKKFSVSIRNGTIYVCKKQNYLRRKYKDFYFSLLKEWKAYNKRYM